MTHLAPKEQVARNTDRELWRERPGDYYADSIFVTEDGRGIGIACGGFVVVKPVREWHRLAQLVAPSVLTAEEQGALARLKDFVNGEADSSESILDDADLAVAACERLAQENARLAYDVELYSKNYTQDYADARSQAEQAEARAADLQMQLDGMVAPEELRQWKNHAARLQAALEEIAKKRQEAIERLKRHGFVFERFPRDMKAEPPVTDGERWEAMAFALYVDVGEMASRAEDALEDAAALAEGPQP